VAIFSTNMPTIHRNIAISVNQFIRFISECLDIGFNQNPPGMKCMELTEPIILIILYFVPVNLISFYLMGSDKRKAIKNKRRISEKTLFLWAVAGGSIGAIFGMKIFRHKTLHLSFTLGMPLIFLIEAAIVVYIATTFLFF